MSQWSDHWNLYIGIVSIGLVRHSMSATDVIYGFWKQAIEIHKTLCLYLKNQISKSSFEIASWFRMVDIFSSVKNFPKMFALSFIDSLQQMILTKINYIKLPKLKKKKFIQIKIWASLYDLNYMIIASGLI